MLPNCILRQHGRLTSWPLAVSLAMLVCSGCRCGEEEEEETGYTVVPVQEENPSVDYTGNMNEARGAEAEMYLQRIAQSARVYYMRDQVSPNGDLVPRQFPGRVDDTPLYIPCGESVNTTSADWSHPVWYALEFSVYEPQYFSYSFSSYGEGPNARFTATARGDLSCSGFPKVYNIEGWVTADGRLRLGGVYEERRH